MSGVDELGVVDPAGEAYWQDIHGTLAPLRERVAGRPLDRG